MTPHCADLSFRVIPTIFTGIVQQPILLSQLAFCLEVLYSYVEVLYTYVLQLEEGKWYVGKTNDPFNRLMQHVNERLCLDTKYAP